MNAPEKVAYPGAERVENSHVSTLSASQVAHTGVECSKSLTHQHGFLGLHSKTE